LKRIVYCKLIKGLLNKLNWIVPKYISATWVSRQ
jgi:hypothetical protein